MFSYVYNKMIKNNRNELVLYDIVRKIMSAAYYVIFKIIKNDLRLIGAKKFKKQFKNSDTMFAMASGASICEYSKSDFKLISKYDSIGVNFFLLHDFEPSFYIMESHKPNIGLFDLLHKKQNKVSAIPYLYKGYGGPYSLSRAISNILCIPRTEKFFLILKDAYMKGKWESAPGHLIDKAIDINRSDFFYNYIATILFVVFMSYKVGYKNVVLCGFDMDDKYFYCSDEKYKSEANKFNLCEERAKNKIANDPWRKNNILSVLIFMNEKFKSNRGGGVYVYSKKMSLSKYLPIYRN